MTKSNSGIAIMDKKILQKAVILSAFFLTGCSCFQDWGADQTYVDTAYETETVTVETKNPAIVPTPAAPVIVPPSASQLPADNNDFVNYTETNANYREFGERTPRDQRIVSAGAGSNMSASIPPTIEEEVSDYEDEINEAMNDDSDNSSSSDSNTASEDPVEDWLAEEGNTLKGLLTDWSERSGWRLIWNTNRNYTLAAGAMFRGRFADVSSALIRSFARARPAPVATFYKGNRVLVVETLEDENAYD